MEPYFGIRISTYRRQGGTFHLAARCIRSIIAQTFTNWKVYLIGDHYVPDDEFMSLVKMLPSDKVYHTNLSYSPERSRYSGMNLWKVAGYTACCLGLRKLTEEGATVCCCLDDDDWWDKTHLQTLWEAYQNFPESAFIYTQSTYKGSTQYLPATPVRLEYNNRPPAAYGLIHSAASWNVKKMPLIYRNIAEEPSHWVAGDADMWERVRNYCNEHHLKTLYVPKLTVRHDIEHGNHQIEPMVI